MSWTQADPRVDPNLAEPVQGQTPLHAAARRGIVRCVEVLLADERVDLCASVGGQTPLISASRSSTLRLLPSPHCTKQSLSHHTVLFIHIRALHPKSQRHGVRVVRIASPFEGKGKRRHSVRAAKGRPGVKALLLHLGFQLVAPAPRRRPLPQVVTFAAPPRVFLFRRRSTWPRPIRVLPFRCCLPSCCPLGVLFCNAPPPLAEA